MKILFAGLGSIGSRHLKNLHGLGYREFFAYSTSTSEKGKSLETEYGIKRLDSFEDGLKQKPDVVFVTNPTAFHVAYARKAVEAGAHVFVEKPLSHTMEGVPELVRSAKERGRIVYVGYHLRFHPILVQIKEAIEKGAIGKPLAAHMSVGQYLPDWHPGEEYRTGYAARKELGGGAILTLSHEIDYALWLMGSVRSVYCLGGHLSTLAVDVEDVAKMLVEFTSGCIADIHLDYLQKPPGRSFQLLGEKGKIEWDYFADRARAFSYEKPEQPVEILVPPGFEKNDMYRTEVAHAMAAFEGREKPRSPLEDGVATLSCALAALASMEKKTPVQPL